MPDFVQLWVYLSSAPLFGLTATLVVYLLAQRFYAAMDQAPWANPVLWSVLALGAGLLATGVPYPSYFAGAQFIHFLLGPAVVALGFHCGSGARKCAAIGGALWPQRWRGARQQLSVL